MGQLGQFVGGVIGVFFLYVIWEWALFKRVADDPVTGKLSSVAAAYATAVIAYGFGEANGGPWQPTGLPIYLPGAIIVAVYGYNRGMKVRENPAGTDAETFE